MRRTVKIVQAPSSKSHAFLNVMVFFLTLCILAISIVFGILLSNVNSNVSSLRSGTNSEFLVLETQANATSDAVAVLQGIPPGIGNTTEEVTIWINQVNGSASNPGTEEEPVSNLDEAFNFVAQNYLSIKDCKFRIVGTLDLGLNPVLCTTPIVRICKHVILTGGQYGLGGYGTDPFEGAIVGSAGEGPTSYTDRITITTSGTTFGTDTYQKQFVFNKKQNRYFVVESNTDTSLRLVSTRASELPGRVTPLYIIPGTPISNSIGWNNGDEIVLFTVQDKFTWESALQLDIPYNQIRFENLIVDPYYGYIQTSQLREPALAMRGVHMVAGETGTQIASILGSFVFQGVYVEENNFYTNAKLISTFLTGFVQLESVWVNSVEIGCGGELDILGLKLEDSNLEMVNCDASGTSIDMTGGGITMEDKSRASLSYVDITEGVITMNSVSELVLGNIRINSPSFQFAFTVLDRSKLVAKSSIMFFNSQVGIVSSTNGDSEIYMATGTLDSDTPFTGDVFYIGPGNSFYLSISLSSTLSTSGAGSSIIDANGATVTLIIPMTIANVMWSTSSGTPLLDMNYGTRYYQNRVPLGQIVNNGPTSTHVLTCGNNAISAFTTSQQDVPTNTFCTYNGVP